VDDCRKSLCADRCRVANGFRDTVYCKNRAVWTPTRNQWPVDVYESGYMKCNCQWMSLHDGLGDDCSEGCTPHSCTYKCRQANPSGTCMAHVVTTEPPTTTPATTTTPPRKVVHACGCDCSWLLHSTDDCRKDMCADRCRLANGIRGATFCENSRAWEPNRNMHPRNVVVGGVVKCDCQWMASNYGLGDNCVGGCAPHDCASQCREVNPLGTCLAPAAVAPAPKPVVHACGCDCSWLATVKDNCRKDACADRCRVANGIAHPISCGYDAYGRALTWAPSRNHRPNDVWENGQRKCDCQWMAGNDGLGDSCKTGCAPSDCAHKCRLANPSGTCFA